MGDISTEDLDSPKKFKLMSQIATKTINRQKKTILYLRTKVQRLQKRVKSRTHLIDHLNPLIRFHQIVIQYFRCGNYDGNSRYIYSYVSM
jgi:hypothetical protein